MLRTGALALSNCRLLRNGFGEIFKDAVKEAGIWLLEVRWQVGVIWAHTYLMPGCFWIAAFCWGLPSPRGLSLLWSKAGTQSHSCCVDFHVSWWRALTAFVLLDLCLFAEGAKGVGAEGKAVRDTLFFCDRRYVYEGLKWGFNHFSSLSADYFELCHAEHVSGCLRVQESNSFVPWSALLSRHSTAVIPKNYFRIVSESPQSLVFCFPPWHS